MNKTFTMIVATVALAGLAFANIATDPAGYLEKTGSGTFVCNPFGTFNGTPCFADLDGSGLSAGTIRVISPAGVATTYHWHNGNWFTEEGGNGTNVSADPLQRGASVQIAGSGTLVVAGPLTNGVANVNLTKGNNFFGNAAPVPKTLGNLSVEDFLPTRGDYVMIGGVKYVYGNDHWYLRSDYLKTGPRTSSDKIKDEVPLASGQGFVIYRATAASTAVLPGTY